MADPDTLPDRRTPAQGVHISLGGPNWVMLNICTKDRARWLATPALQRALHDVWARHATAWLVSDYLLMPDHLHLFCAPKDLKCTIERWVAFWKDRVSKTVPEAGAWQRGSFHHRLRSGESYAQKWLYVRENPVRAGFVDKPEDWPYQGRVHDIRWG